MRRRWHYIYLDLLVMALLVLGTNTIYAQITVVNMIPNAQSNETNQDSEPNIAVNPSNPLHIAGSAFTPNPFGGDEAPIYVSEDGGYTWRLNFIVPSQAGSISGTGDITLRFSGTDDFLYAGILRYPGFLRLNILRTDNFLGASTMTVLVDRYKVDQPYVQATAVGSDDRVYVGNNDFNALSGKTATIDQSFDANAPVPAFASARIETRSTSGQDGPPIRPAIHSDGTVYAIFYGWRSFKGAEAKTDVVVVRDDNGGTGANPFTDLTDADTLAGRLVVKDVIVPWANYPQSDFGQERFVGSNISIAVDPRDSDVVYIAWADRPSDDDAAPLYALHVQRSMDRGVTWSTELRTIYNATNPALAINSNGTVGFLYQKVTGVSSSQRWVTHIELTDDAFVTVEDHVLADVPANMPLPTFIPYIGDYVHLMTVDLDFYGIFSANNTPDYANFPNGVTYQRNADFSTNTLLDHNNERVDVSIDPFFFSVKPEIKPPKFEYAAKFVCGLQKDPEDMRLARGFYATAINIHNPNTRNVKIFKKLALTYPPEEQKPGEVMTIGKDILGYDEALEVDCMDIRKKLFPNGFPTSYIKGFVIIQSPASLDVTAVYTTVGLDKQANLTDHVSIDVEQVSERKRTADGVQRLPDLVPVPPPALPGTPEKFCKIEDGKLVVMVKNQGAGPADPSITEVDFFSLGKATMPTIALAPNASTELFFDIPSSVGEQWEFRITVDAMSEVAEADEGNNVADGLCITIK